MINNKFYKFFTELALFLVKITKSTFSLYNSLRGSVYDLVYNLFSAYLNIQLRFYDIISSYKSTFIFRSVRKKIYIFFFVFFLISTYRFFSFYVMNFSIWAVTTLMWLMPVLLLLQTYVFLYKTSRVSKYLNAVQKFWKRALFIFWIIEVFLFLILIFLWLNAPETLKYGNNHNFFLRKLSFSLGNYTEMYLLPGLILVLSHLLIFLKKSNKVYIFNIVLLLIMFLLVHLINLEFEQLNEVFGKSTQLLVLIKEERVEHETFGEFNSLSSAWEEDITFNFFKMLLLFLKFWHILFIVIFYMFIYLRYIEYKSIGYDVLSANAYNMTYILVFNSLFFIVLKKRFFYRLMLTPSEYYYLQYLTPDVKEVLQNIALLLQYSIV